MLYLYSSDLVVTMYHRTHLRGASDNIITQHLGVFTATCLDPVKI